MAQLLYLLLFLCLGCSAVPFIQPQSQNLEPPTNEPVDKVNEVKIPSVNIKYHNPAKVVKKVLKDPGNTTVTPNDPKSQETNNIQISDTDSPQIESGAVIRGILVFVGISMIFIVYLGCKTYRKKNVNIIVRKYGVRTRRSDVEMRPLPLDDDEEDETVFDVGNFNKP